MKMEQTVFRNVGIYNSVPAYEDGTDSSETSEYQIQTPGNYRKKTYYILQFTQEKHDNTWTGWLTPGHEIRTCQFGVRHNSGEGTRKNLPRNRHHFLGYATGLVLVHL